MQPIRRVRSCPSTRLPQRQGTHSSFLRYWRPAEGGAVQLYSVQSQAQLNRQHNAGARTADFAGVSGPRYLSINNGFGRPWVANAPFGLRGTGSESVPV